MVGGGAIRLMIFLKGTDSVMNDSIVVRSEVTTPEGGSSIRTAKTEIMNLVWTLPTLLDQTLIFMYK